MSNLKIKLWKLKLIAARQSVILRLNSKKLVISFINIGKIPVIQQELSQTVEGKKSAYGDDSMPLRTAKITNETDLNLKNLGPQMKWHYVFYIEYAGPLIIFPLLFLLGHK